MARCVLRTLAVFGVGTLAIRHKRQSADVGAESMAVWDSYVASYQSKAQADAGGLQPNCNPVVYEAKGTYRGAIMLHHGFTACPQQFFQIAPMLQAQGYTVFLPLLPGNGYEYAPNSTGGFDDYYLNLPEHHEEYESFADTMHTVMMLAAGEKGVGGLSVGGGVAAYQNYLGGYDRALLMAPMILANGVLHALINLARWVPSLARARQEWGAGCELERTQGRAGICQFDAMKVSGAIHVGQEHNEKALNGGANFGEGGMQIVFVDEDDSVSTNAIINLGIKYGFSKEGSSSMICGLDNDLPHSFFSTWDNQEMNMYWLGEVEAMIVNYMANGVNFPQSGKSTSDWPRCDVRCTAGTCQQR